MNIPFKQIEMYVSQLPVEQKVLLINLLSEEISETNCLNILASHQDAYSTCPHCNSNRIKHHGKIGERQRYFCNNCGKTFMCTFNTPFYRLRKPEKWLSYFKCMRDSKTIRSSAHEISVNKNTSFLWRHKFLKLLNIQKDTHLSGIIEIDETFFRYSEKGSRHITHPKNDTKKRGRIKNGSVPVIVARDRQQNTFDLVMNSLKINDVYKVVKDHIEPDSIICSDSYPIYPLLCKKLKLVHKKINIKQHIRIVENVFHIQNVNSYHSQLKYWMNRFHGVATKNLNNYLAWFRFLESKEEPNENSLLLAQTQLIQN